MRSEQRLNADGSIWLRYAPQSAGPRCLSVKLKGVHVLGSPLRLDVNPGALHLPSCEISGDGSALCHLNERQTFKLRAKDHFGNMQLRGGERFHISIARPDTFSAGQEASTTSALTPSVRDDGDGTYMVEYLLDRVGVWGLSVRHGSADGELMPGAPLPLTCLAGSAHLPSCSFISAQHGTRVLGAERDLSCDDDLHPSKGTTAPHLGHVAACGSKLRVMIRLNDKAGQATRMSGPRQVQLALLPERDPLDPSFGSAAMNGGSSSWGAGGEGRAYDSTLVGWVNAQLKAQRLADKSGGSSSATANAITASSSAVAPAPATGSSSAGLAALEAPDGAFEGASIVTLTRVSSDRLGSKAPVDISEGEEGNAEGGSSAGCDEESKLREAKAALAADATALYEAQIDLRKARRYRMSLCGASGQHCLGPAIATLQVVAGRAHPPSCVLGGEGLEKGFVGSPVDFWMRTYDAAGNALSQGGEKVNVIVKSPGHNNDVVVKVRDEKDGGYALKFIPTASGMYTLTVKMGRETVGQPANIMIYRSPTSAANALKLNLGVPPLPTAERGMNSARDSARAAPASARRASSPHDSARGGVPNSARRDASPRGRSSVSDSSPRVATPGSYANSSASSKRANSPRGSTPRIERLNTRDIERDELAPAPVSARASYVPPAPAPSKDAASASKEVAAFAPSAAPLAGEALAAPRGGLPPKLHIPVRADGENGCVPAPASARGHSGSARRATPPRAGSPRVEPGGRGVGQRLSPAARMGSPRASSASMAPSAAPLRPSSPRRERSAAP